MAKVTIRFHETTPPQRRQMIRDLAKRVDIDESLDEVMTTLRQFEDKYGMSTVEFYARFITGKMGDARDFIEWAGDFIRYHRLVQLCSKRQKRAVKSQPCSVRIQRDRQIAPSDDVARNVKIKCRC